MTDEPTVMTAEEMLRRPGFKHHELIDGVPVEKHLGALAAYTAGQLACLLMDHCKPRRLGWVFGGNAGYHCFPGRPNLVRKPDASVVHLPNDELPEGWITVAPVLAVKAISFADQPDEIEDRVAEYRSAGVPLVWVFSPKHRRVLVRRLDGTAAEVGPDGELSGEDVVPGFACKVADLFV